MPVPYKICIRPFRVGCKRNELAYFVQQLSGLVFNIQRFSTEDGPGIRTTVFMKGCPLRCKWCHNPEGLSSAPQLVWYDIRCIGAKECVKICSETALKFTTSKGIKINSIKCNNCGKCVDACPSNALEITGKYWTTTNLLIEVLKDKSFYDKSDGGITISGGEPLIQSEFLMKFLPLARNEKIHIAIDTSGYVSEEVFKKVIPLVDLVLFDIKQLDYDLHIFQTGVKYNKILNNAKLLSQTKTPVWIRIPIIPGMTDSISNISAIGDFIKNNMSNVERIDLLPFMNLCTSKYKRLNIAFPLGDEPSLPDRRLTEFGRILESKGLKNVRWIGHEEILP